MTDTDDLSRLLEPLEQLSDLLPVEQIAAAVQRFADKAIFCSDLHREVVRARAIEFLRSRRIASSAKSIDAALKYARRLRAAADGGGNSDAMQGSSVIFSDVELWPQPVEGAELLTDLVASIQSFVQLPRDCAVAIALWILHTHTVELAHCSPRLTIVSPTRRCGKTTLLRVLDALVARPLSTANLSAAVLFRLTEQYGPTLLIDEADTFARENDELRGVINAGHARGGVVYRCSGDQHEPRAFRVFGAMAIAAIGQLPDTIMDRSVVIAMQRKTAGEVVRPLRRAEVEELVPLARRCARWAKDARVALESSRPLVPSELNDRAADNWESLLAIASSAGEEWADRAREAATSLSAAQGRYAMDDLAEQLLVDIRELMARDGLGPGASIATQSLLRALRQLDGHPWADLGGREGLSVHQLARLLRPFGIAPRTFRDGGKTPKGYSRSSLTQAFARYLPAESATTATSLD